MTCLWASSHVCSHPSSYCPITKTAQFHQHQVLKDCHFLEVSQGGNQQQKGQLRPPGAPSQGKQQRDIPGQAADIQDASLQCRSHVSRHLLRPRPQHSKPKDTEL